MNLKFFLDRAKEPSTWRGIALIVGGFGIHIAPDLIPTIGTAVAAFIGAVEMIRKEG
jgi:hypothetical protein